jgi:outer membrane protein assembly factor BamB
MKTINSILLLSAIIFSAMPGLSPALCAQVSIANPVWKSNFPNKPGFLLYTTSDGNYVVGTNTTNAAVLDGKSGKLKWNANFESLLGTKKCDIQYVMDEAGVLLLYRSKGRSDMLHVIDLETGKELWNSEKFQKLALSSIIYLPELGNFIINTSDVFCMIEARTGNELWQTSKFTGSVAYSKFDIERNELLLLNYKTSWGALLSGYKNQIMSINVATGDVNWEQSYFGVMHINPRSNKPVFEMIVDDNEIYLMVMGLQVLDRNTGKEKWRTEFDLFDQKANLGAPGYTYFYKGIAYPHITEDAVYLVYNKLASSKVNIQKLNKSNGNLLWEYRVDGKNTPVPTLKVADGKLIVQLGGRINIVGPQKVGSTWITSSKYKWVGNFGVLALDLTDGKVIWEHKKLSDQITNVEVSGDKVFFADAKKLYAANLSDGELIKSADVKKIKCGAPFEIVVNGDHVFCIGQQGLGSVRSTDFSLDWSIASSKTDDHSEQSGNLYLLKGDKAMHLVNLTNGKIAATYKYAKGVKYSLLNLNNEKELFVMGAKEAIKYNL